MRKSSIDKGLVVLTDVSLTVKDLRDNICDFHDNPVSISDSEKLYYYLGMKVMASLISNYLDAVIPAYEKGKGIELNLDAIDFEKGFDSVQKQIKMINGKFF